MFSDDVLQVADDPLSPKQPLIEMIIVAVPELPEAREQTCRRSGCDGLPLPLALAIPRQRPLDVQQIPLAGDGVPSPVPVAYSVRQPPFRPRKAAPGRSKGCLWLSLCHREHLPVPLEPQIVGVKPAFDQQAELFQLALVGAECRHVVHVPGVMLAQAALPDELVEGLQDGVGKPLGSVRPQLYAVPDDAPDEVEDAAVLVELPHPGHDDFRGQAVVKVADVTAKLVLRPLAVVLHPSLDGVLFPVRPALPDRAAAVKIHSLHHPGLQDLDEGVVDVLVGPLGRFADGAPFPGVRVPPLADMGIFRLKAADEYSPQVFHPLRLGLFHPSRTGVGLVTSIPVVGAVHFVDGKQQIIV